MPIYIRGEEERGLEVLNTISATQRRRARTGLLLRLCICFWLAPPTSTAVGCSEPIYLNCVNGPTTAGAAAAGEEEEDLDTSRG